MVVKVLEIRNKTFDNRQNCRPRFTSEISFENFGDLEPLTRFSAILVFRTDWCVFLCLRALEKGCMQAPKIQMVRQLYLFRCFPVFLLSEDL